MRACRSEHHERKRDGSVDGQDVAAPDERPVHDADREQRSGASVVCGSQVSRSTIRAHQLNAKANGFSSCSKSWLTSLMLASEMGSLGLKRSNKRAPPNLTLSFQSIPSLLAIISSLLPPPISKIR